MKTVRMCNLCNSNNGGTSYLYPVKPFNLRLPGNEMHTTEDDFAACFNCHELIEKDERNKLVERALEEFTQEMKEAGVRIPADIYNSTKRFIEVFQERFFSHRLGPCTLIEKVWS